MAVLSNLQPEKVFYYFEKLCSVPHGSGNTKQISDLCVGFAKELGLKYRQEACNNVIIWKNGSCGYENAAPIILQGHIDMVCAKTEDCTKDMTRDGLDVRTDGEWVWADKTSLGGDNGIAVAIQSELGIPVKYVGVGEKIDDLQKFSSGDFVNALFQSDTRNKGE